MIIILRFYMGLRMIQKDMQQYYLILNTLRKAMNTITEFAKARLN